MAWLVHDPLTRFIAQIVAITIASRLVGLVLRRFGQPLVIAEMLGGIALGPSLLGWLAPDVSSALFAPDSLGALRLVSQFGLVFFMFLVGLELDLRRYSKNSWAAVVIAQSGMIVPFVLGCGFALWMYPRYADPATPRATFIVFLGTAMSVTAFPVLARILTERRLLQTRIGVIAIACAAIDDITAWCLLAFVVAVARNAEMWSAAVTSLAALGFIAVMIFVVRPLLARFAARIPNAEAPSHNTLAFVLVLVLAAAWATELIGIHALFGGFLLGAIFPRARGLSRAVAHRFEDVIVVVFLPLFFAYSGLRTQIGLLGSGAEWAACGLVVLVACTGKFGGCTLAARATGSSWREASAIGVLMNTRGLMELVVLNIGYDLGVISPIVFSMMVIMALVTTLSTIPLVDWIAPTPRPDDGT